MITTVAVAITIGFLPAVIALLWSSNFSIPCSHHLAEYGRMRYLYNTLLIYLEIALIQVRCSGGEFGYLETHKLSDYVDPYEVEYKLNPIFRQRAQIKFLKTLPKH
jgi:hypothetical protein